jgi:hypothetical protein
VLLVLIFVGLKVRLGTIGSRVLASSTARITAASIVAAAAGWGTARLLSSDDHGAIARALPGLGGVIVFGLLYFGVAWGLGSREVDALAGPVRRRLKRR